MKRNQSILENSISSLYFAVQPLSLFFLRDYNSTFNLYFEKGLQIISKNEGQSPNPRKEELVYFSAPSVAPHFRIQSDKNLDYEWSLYASQQEGDQHEQFVEGQKVSLKTAWQRFTEIKVNVWEGQLDFNAIKCKLTYLVVIAKSAPELQQLLQQHLQLLNQPVAAPSKPEEKSSSKAIQVEEEVRKEEGSAKEINSQETPKKESIVEISSLPVGEMKESKILNEFPSPEGDSSESPKRVSATRDRERPLSHSEIQIAEVMGKEVEEYEASKIEVVEPIAEVAEVAEEHPAETLELKEVKDEGQEIRMTNSQLLDEKREVISPPSSKFGRSKLIILAFVLAIVMSAVVYFSLRVESEDLKKIAKERKPEIAKGAKTPSSGKGAKQGKGKTVKQGKGVKEGRSAKPVKEEAAKKPAKEK